MTKYICWMWAFSINNKALKGISVYFVQEVWEAGHHEWGVESTPSPGTPAMPRSKRRSAADMGPDDDDRHCNKRFRNTTRLGPQF